MESFRGATIDAPGTLCRVVREKDRPERTRTRDFPRDGQDLDSGSFDRQEARRVILSQHLIELARHAPMTTTRRRNAQAPFGKLFDFDQTQLKDVP